MKIKNVIMISLLTILLALSVVLYIYQDNNNYAFKVNGEKVTIVEYEKYLSIQKKAIMSQSGQEQIDWNELDANGIPLIDDAKSSAKDYTVDMFLLKKEAQKRKITLSDEDKKEIQEEATSSQYQYFQTLYGLTENEIIQMLEDAKIQEKLAIALYKETDHTGHEHGNVDIEKYENGIATDGDKYSARHILFSTKEKTEDEKVAIKAKAESVLKRIKNGEDFATLATQYTEDPGSQATGGLYEDVLIGQFVQEFEDAALSLNNGEVYPELVESVHGYHIIKLEAKSDALSTIESEEIIYNEFVIWANEIFANAEVELGEQYYSIGIE